MPVNKRFFDDLMKDRRLSLRSIARQMDMLPSQLSLTLSGKRRMQITEAVRLGQILGAPLSDVMIAAGIEEAKLDRRRCNVIGHLLGTGEVELVDKGAIERVTVPDGLPDGVFAIQARTMDSQFSYMDGWLFYGKSERQDPSELLSCFCMVKLEGGPIIISTIRRGYSPGTYNLQAGPVNITSARIEWASRILMGIY